MQRIIVSGHGSWRKRGKRSNMKKRYYRVLQKKTGFIRKWTGFAEEKESERLCCCISRILFKEHLALYRRQNGSWISVFNCSLYHFMDGTEPKRDRRIRQILMKNMGSAVLAVVASAGEKGKDYHGFWLAGGTWNIISVKSTFFRQQRGCHEENNSECGRT